MGKLRIIFVLTFIIDDIILILFSLPRDIAMRKIVNMKAKILNAMVCILCRVDHHMLLCCVQHVGHTKALEVGDVTHCLTITNDNSRINLEIKDIEFILKYL